MRARHSNQSSPWPTWQSIEGMSQQQYYSRFLDCVGKREIHIKHFCLDASSSAWHSLMQWDELRHTIAQVLSCCAVLNIWWRPLGRKDFHQHPWQGVNCAHTSFPQSKHTRLWVMVVSLTPVFHCTTTYQCVSDLTGHINICVKLSLPFSVGKRQEFLSLFQLIVFCFLFFQIYYFGEYNFIRPKKWWPKLQI